MFERFPEDVPIVLNDEVTLDRTECLPLLAKEVMSDEDDDEMASETVARTIKVKVPRWRSEKVNTVITSIIQPLCSLSVYL